MLVIHHDDKHIVDFYFCLQEYDGAILGNAFTNQTFKDIFIDMFPSYSAVPNMFPSYLTNIVKLWANVL